MKRPNIIKDKSFAFALRIVKLNKFLIEKKEFVLSKQLLRSGTAVGALVREAEHAESSADFIHKMTIALKETRETKYWLTLALDAELVPTQRLDSILQETDEIAKILFTIIKNAKTNKP